MATTLHQESTSTLDDSGTPKFRIASSISELETGDLPFTEIFLHQILDATDPKQDKFLRVADLHDLASYQRGRDTAIANAGTYYLSGLLTLDFTDITTAVAAKAVVQTRVDKLITDWIAYSTEFTSPADFTLPSATTLVTAALTTYLTAKATAVTKTAALTVADAALAEAEAAAARAATALTSAITATLAFTQIQQTFATGLAGEGTFRTAVTNFVTAASVFEDVANSGGGVGVNPTFESALNTIRTAQAAEAQYGLAVLTSAQSLINTLSSNATTAMSGAATAKTTADLTAASAQTAQALADEEATVASAAEAAALAALLIVDPDYEV